MEHQENKNPEKKHPPFFDELGVAMDHAEEIIFVVDWKLNVVYGNRAFHRMAEKRSKLPPSSFLNSSLRELFPFLSPQLLAGYGTILREGKPTRSEEQLEIDGSEYLVRTRRIPLQREGEWAWVLTMVRDITRTKSTQRALETSEELLRATLEATADGILVVDRDGKATHTNKRFSTMWCIPAQIMETRDDEKLLEFVLDQLVDPASFLAKVKELYNSREQGQDTLHFKDGRVFERFSSPLLQKGEIVGRVWNFRDVSEQKRVEETLRTNEVRARLQQRSLMNLVRSDLIVSKGLDSALEQVTEEATVAQGLERASIWLFNPDGKELRCVDLFQRSIKLHTRDMVLHTHRYPTYFGALRSERVVDASCALLDERTREFANDYLEPLGISSMLDAAIRVAGNVVGVVCLEHTGKSRIWGPDEIGFVRELAAHVGKLLTEADRQHSEKVRELVYDITRASNTARDHSELFLLIKEKLASVIDTTNFFIVLYDKEKDTLTLPYFVDEKDSFTTIPARKTLTAHMIHLGVPLLVSEDDTRELVAKGLIDMVGTPSKSWLGIPLKVAEEIIGAVVVQSYTDSVTYTDNDLEILQFVSEQIAIAIHRRGTEEGLMREKAHLEELLESSPEAIVLTDNSGRVQRINGEFSRLFGYQEEEAVGRYIDNLVADGDQYQEASDNTRQVAQGERVVAETIRYHKDKSPIHVSILGTPIRIQDGQIAIFSIYRDIGERKRAELQIREKSQQLFYEKQLWEDTFDAMAEGISVHDENYRITRVNAALCRLLGKSREDILGKHCYQVFHNRDRQPPFCPMKRSLAERTQATEEIFEPSLGKYLLISSSPILGNEEEGGEKRLLGVIHSVQDITVLKEREKKLEELNVELKAADKQKSEFVSIVSHDFGNPLGVIQGNVELMLLGAYGELEPKMKTKLETIQNTTKRLNKLRTDTLDLAKMDLGQMELEPRNDDLEKLVRAALEQTLPMAEKKGQTIEFQDPGSFILNYDSARIFQVVDNYLSNAVRYTPEGGFIQLTLQELGSEIMFCVKDDGRGIPEDELENVFRRFYRVGERVQGSTGLGLSIVKGIILAHGGRCWAESDGLGRGTTFCFALPKN